MPVLPQPRAEAAETAETAWPQQAPAQEDAAAVLAEAAEAPA
jgi:hypothetical protein